MNSYITCDLLGPGDGKFNFGLGNQMFQIATLYSYAKDNNCTVSVPQIKLAEYGSYHNNIFSKVNTERIYDDMFTYYYEPKFSYTPLPITVNLKLRGYFQSEKYFKHNRKLILDLFSEPQYVTEYINTKYGSIIDKHTIAVHVRRGDYVEKQDYHPLCSNEYYSDALKYIVDNSKEFDIKNIAVFSDDINYCTTIFAPEQNIYFINNEKDYIDLFLMSRCGYHVIANSSFSWWGAWLSKCNENQIVVSPKKWFGPSKNLDTSDIIPENWIQL
jgi:hypothetical protein